jgi:hypothetical protein
MSRSHTGHPAHRPGQLPRRLARGLRLSLRSLWTPATCWQLKLTVGSARLSVGSASSPGRHRSAGDRGACWRRAWRMASWSSMIRRSFSQAPGALHSQCGRPRRRIDSNTLVRLASRRRPSSSRSSTRGRSERSTSASAKSSCSLRARRMARYAAKVVIVRSCRRAADFISSDLAADLHLGHDDAELELDGVLAWPDLQAGRCHCPRLELPEGVHPRLGALDRPHHHLGPPDQVADQDADLCRAGARWRRAGR